jgi:DNA mismatch repair protein MutS2
VIYPNNFEQKTGFDRIRDMLLEKCISSLGKEHIYSIRFLTNLANIEVLLNQTEEFRQILLENIFFPGANYYNPEVVFNRLRLEGTFAEPEELLDIRLSLDTIGQVMVILNKTRESGEWVYPSLWLLVDGLALDPALPKRIDAIIDEKAIVRNSASPELARIRRSRQELDIKATRRINQLMSEGKSQGWIAQDIELALRNGRQVIPVAAAYKRKIRGFVHDQSATGQTVFLEPEEVFELNNQIRELEFEERQEIVRILKEFANEIRPMLPMLLRCYNMLGQVDAIRAKARLAIDMDAYKPKLGANPKMHWVHAKHPLLYLSYKQQKKHVEPFSLELDETNRILIISGPNAGGKSVCLKSCGLIQYMLQCGLLVPMTDYSETGIFEKLFIDIGDEQSLENDLSTYSSHLVNMRFFSEHSDTKTLFLIDEFGTGTEPRIGGAIAESVLELLNGKHALGVVTTHYANLKIMAGKHDGMLNGSMLFDTRNMKPLFKLKTGNPGSSFAFEIARTIGLPEHVLQRAAELAGSQDIDFDRQLQDLELKKIEIEQKEKQLHAADGFLSDMIDKYDALNTHLESKKSDILLKARQEAKTILQGTNKIIEQTIREIRENQARQEETRLARKTLDVFVKSQESALNELEKPKPVKKVKPQVAKDAGPIVPGDPVRIAGQQSIGEVIDISGQQAVVAFGSIKLKTPLNKLEKILKSSLPVNKYPHRAPDFLSTSTKKRQNSTRKSTFVGSVRKRPCP